MGGGAHILEGGKEAWGGGMAMRGLQAEYGGERRRAQGGLRPGIGDDGGWAGPA